MKEKIGALIQFFAVVVGFILIFWGVSGAYQSYFNREDLLLAEVIYNTTYHLIGVAIGAGVGIGGVIVGNILKKI